MYRYNTIPDRDGIVRWAGFEADQDVCDTVYPFVIRNFCCGLPIQRLCRTAHSLWRAPGFGMVSLRSCICFLGYVICTNTFLGHLKTYLFVRTGVWERFWVVTLKGRYINFWINERLCFVQLWLVGIFRSARAGWGSGVCQSKTLLQRWVPGLFYYSTVNDCSFILSGNLSSTFSGKFLIGGTPSPAAVFRISP